MPRARRTICTIGGLAVAIALLAGCAGGPDGQVNAGLVGAGGCKQIKRELGRYEARGIQYKADAANRGARLSAKQRPDVRRYNELLDSYLGNQCHV